MLAILFEVLLINIQEESHHFAVWKGGGVERDLRCLDARDLTHDPLANQIASESNRAI